jgi:hypothetical protein
VAESVVGKEIEIKYYKSLERRKRLLLVLRIREEVTF